MDKIQINMPDRPLECSECKRPIAVCYTEIIGDKMTRTWMCAECPVLERRLYGKVKSEEALLEEEKGSVSCANCNSTLEEIRTGHTLGCPLCYEVFADVLIDELAREGAISKHLSTNKKTMPLHMGRAPGEVTEVSPTLRLIALNEALDEMLVREDYEQAALLRDQIRTLKEKTKQDDRKK